MVITGRRSDYFIDSDGKMIDEDTIEHHLTNVIGGLYSLGGQPDVAMIETLVHFDPAFSRLTYHGVPDIRVIVYKGYPVMAMSRLPTRRSHGKANLHQGAIGVGIDLGNRRDHGWRFGQFSRGQPPRIRAPLLPVSGFPAGKGSCRCLPRCYEAVGLGYLGVDIVLDRDLGPLILELNARPGLNIQLANRKGLRHPLAGGGCHLGERHDSPEQRAQWSAATFGTANPDTPVAIGLLQVTVEHLELRIYCH